MAVRSAGRGMVASQEMAVGVVVGSASARASAEA